ncbi:MAG TPA: CAP domain-containing protein [Candidatus Dormibacteraeota bacterium]|nr:CAP domain-containing protein [Candidatus Dormibacteraeota bacterium]
MSRRIRAAVLAAVAISASFAVATLPAKNVAASGIWLDRLNAWRTASGLPNLTENTTWSQGDWNHSQYMVMDDQVTHYEVSTLPYYTVAGDTAARNGNIEVRSNTSFTDDQAIDWWMAAPFHELGMTDPRLSSTGFGSFRYVKSGWQAGFTLDTLRGNSFSGGTYPVFFPGNGSLEPLTTFGGGEFPDPLQACPGYAAPTGLPVTIQVGGNVATSVTAHAFTGNGTPLAHCVIDSSNASLGSSLTSRGAVILIPQQPLQPGVNYVVALTVNGVPYTWHFGVSSDNSISGATCTAAINVAPTQSTTAFTFSVSAAGCAGAFFDLQQYDSTLNEGWFGLNGASAGAASTSATASAEGFQGHTYQFRARAHLLGGLVGAWTTASTTISPTATKAHAWSGLYTLDGYGGIHLADSPPLDNSPYWPWTAARAVKALPGANAPQNGFVLDAWGGLHPYGSPALQIGQEPYYPNLDVARDFVFLPNGTGGYELDGWGGIHPFSIGNNPLPPQPWQYPYFPGQDVAKKIWLLPDASGGYVLDAFGGLHPWSVTGKPLPAQIAEYGYWYGQNIARDFWVGPGTSATSASGYVLDAFGGFHPFWTAGTAAPATVTTYGYWYQVDIARGMWLLPTATPSTASGYVLDGFGGIHPFSVSGQPLPPAISQYGYWPGRDIAKSIWGA